MRDIVLLMNTKFSSIVKELIDSGLTQSEIAKKCSTSQGHISDILSGRRKCPNWILGDALVNLHKEVKSQNDLGN